MANVATKVEKWGLEPLVLDLLRRGVTTPTAIAQELNEYLLSQPKNDGKQISRSAVSHYLDEKKPDIRKIATEVFKDHVDKVMPGDLKTIEEIQARALGMSRETVENRHARLAEAAASLKSEIRVWVSMVKLAGDPDKEDDAVKWIIARALKIVAGDDAEQAKVLAAMKMVLATLDLKLSKAAMLEDTERGSIFIVDSSGEYVATAVPGKERVPFTMPSGPPKSNVVGLPGRGGAHG